MMRTVRQWIYTTLFVCLGGDAAQTGQRIHSVYLEKSKHPEHRGIALSMELHTFIAQLPQIPSLQLRRNVRVGSNSFLIRINASSIMGPAALLS
jgi:hypothetical protein